MLFIKKNSTGNKYGKKHRHTRNWSMTLSKLYNKLGTINSRADWSRATPQGGVFSLAALCDSARTRDSFLQVVKEPPEGQLPPQAFLAVQL